MDALHLGEDDTDVLGASRHLDACGHLHRLHEGERVARGTDAADPFSEVDSLHRVVAVHADPLDAAVNLSGGDVHIDDFLSVDAEVKPNGLVESRMDRPQRQRVAGLLNRVTHVEYPVCPEEPSASSQGRSHLCATGTRPWGSRQG